LRRRSKKYQKKDNEADEGGAKIEEKSPKVDDSKSKFHKSAKKDVSVDDIESAVAEIEKEEKLARARCR
jgi:hypothetical protein